MGTMPGQGALPPHVVARMIEKARADGKCASVSTLGYICTNPAGHQGAHVAQNALGVTADSWVEAPDAWTADCSPTANTRLVELANRGDHLHNNFKTVIQEFEHKGLDFIQTWERVEDMIGIAVAQGLTRQSAMELLSYFITRCCWSNPDTIPKRDE